jgi:hypothetical protein
VIQMCDAAQCASPITRSAADIPSAVIDACGTTSDESSRCCSPRGACEIEPMTTSTIAINR